MIAKVGIVTTTPISSTRSQNEGCPSPSSSAASRAYAYQGSFTGGTPENLNIGDAAAGSKADMRDL